MSDSEMRALATDRSIVRALADEHPSWVTLPADQDATSPELVAALDEFDAGRRPAAVAATEWLKRQSLVEHRASRTRLLVAEHRIAGFYSLASAHVALRQRDRQRLAVATVSVPAALVTWLAKDERANVDGKVLLMHAAATARRVATLQATAVLVVDPFDDQTATMWMSRFGFRRSADKLGRRLWLPLHTLP